MDNYDPVKSAVNYADDIASGRVVACESIVGSCKRFFKDLSRQNTEEFPYYFDEEHAGNVCMFFPTLVRHSIGKDAGKPFYLQPWQAFTLSQLFGWKRQDNDCRRFTKGYISVARKNGKSTFAAGLCLFVAGYDLNPTTGSFESVAQVVIAASKKEQAERVTMAETVRMRSRAPSIMEASEYKNRQINFNHNNGHIIAIGSDKAFDGLNPSMVVIDELHAFRSTGLQAEFVDTMKTGSGARSQPLFLITTTAGSTTSELWKSEWAYATGVATGTYIDETYLSMSYELDEEDDPLDPKNWIKANPCLGVTLTNEYLQDQAKPAAADSIALNRFTRYHGNRMVSSLNGAFPIDAWKACAGELSDWREADTIGGGIDLGGRNDLAAWAMVARFKTGEMNDIGQPVFRYEVKSGSYIAQDTPRDLTRQPFATFVGNDILRVSKYPVSELEQDFISAAREHGCFEVAFDPYQAQRSAENIESNGVPAVAMPQTTGHFNTPITELRQCMIDGRLRHNGCALLSWCVSNAVTETDKQDRQMLCKRESSEKIDPVVAMVMAFSRASAAPCRDGGYFLI
jgi:phage terminase large subunit-like protein